MSINSRYDNIYRKVIPVLFKVLVFFMPLIFVLGTNEIFEFPKTYFAYAIGSTIIWLFLLNSIMKEKKIRAPNIYVLSFITAYLLSTILSSHTYTSFWGYYTRFNGGLFSILILVGIYSVLDNEFKKKDIIKLVSIGSMAIFPIGIYAILQHFGVNAQMWKGDPTVRAFSTLGQPNWLAAYLGMYLPFIFWTIITPKENTGIVEENRFFNSLLFIIGFSALWFTYSISGLLGVLAGMLFAVLLNLKITLKNLPIVGSLVAICLTISFLTPGIFDEKIKDIFLDIKKVSTNLVTVYAQSENANNISDPGFIRKHLWQGTINLAKSSTKNLIVGTGPETFPYEFQKFRPKELNTSSEWNLVFNKPHNYYLELLSNIGILGLIAYLTLIVSAIKSFDKIFLPGLIALFVTNIFGWPTISTALLFWIFLLGTQKSD